MHNGDPVTFRLTVSNAAGETVGPTVGSVTVSQPEVLSVALLFAGATIFFGIFPSPLFDFAAHAGHAIAGLF